MLYFSETKRAKIGLGTRKLKGPQAILTIKKALQLGYRTIDTAWIYNNEKEVQQAIKISAIPRSEIWITSKAWFNYVPDYKQHVFTQGDFSYSLRKKRFETHLKALGIEYIDELLIHRPTRVENDLALLSMLADYQKQGLIRHVGVSNFPVHYLKKLRNKLPCQISTNQIEFHPCLRNFKILDFAKEKNLILTAYSPLGNGHLLKNQTLISIANKHQVSPAQICIARCLSQNLNILVKAREERKLLDNLQAQSVKLDKEDFSLIDKLPTHYRYNIPPFSPQWD